MNALGKSADAEWHSQKTTNKLRDSPKQSSDNRTKENEDMGEKDRQNQDMQSTMASRHQAGLTDSHDLYRGAEQDSKYAHTSKDSARNQILDNTPTHTGPTEPSRISNNLSDNKGHHRSDAEWQAAIDQLPPSTKSTNETNTFLPSKSPISNTSADFLSHAGNYHSSANTNMSASNIQSSVSNMGSPSNSQQSTNSSSGGGVTEKLEETYHSAKDKLFGALDTVTHPFRSSDSSNKNTNDSSQIQDNSEIQSNSPTTQNFDSSRTDKEITNDRESDTSRDNIDNKAANSSSGFGNNLNKEFQSAKETVQKDFDIAKNKISDTYDAAKEKMQDLGGSFNKEKSDATARTNENVNYEQDASIGNKLNNSSNLSNYSKDSAYVTAASATSDSTYITDENALEAGARLGNATEQMTEL